MLPGLYDRWGWPKLILVVAALLISLWVVPAGRIPRWFGVSMLVAAALLTAAALFGDAPITQIFGRAPRYEGLVALVPIVLAAWAAARLLGPDSRPSTQRASVAAAATAAIALAAVATLEAVGFRPIESDLARPGSLVGNATDQGILGVILLALLGSLAIGGWRRGGVLARWAIAGSLASVASVILSASRAAALAMAVVLVALAVRWILTSMSRGRDALVAMVVVIAVAVAAFAVPLTRSRVFEAGGFAGRTIEDRWVIWESAWRVFRADPLRGVGPSGFMDAVTPVLPEHWYERTSVSAVLDSPHNLIVQIAVAGGLFAMVFAVALGASIWVTGVRRRKVAEGARRDLLTGGLVAALGAGIALLTTPTSPATLIPLALIAGLLVADRPVGGSRSSMITARVGSAVLLALLLLWTLADALVLQGARLAADGGVGEDAFEAARALRPWDTDIALIAAAAYGGRLERGDASVGEVAGEWAGRAVAGAPSSARAWEASGMIALQRGDLESASRDLGRAAELAPVNPRVWHELGIARLLSADPSGARSALARATELDPDAAPSWLALRDACAALGDVGCVEHADVQSRRVP